MARLGYYVKVLSGLLLAATAGELIGLVVGSDGDTVTVLDAQHQPVFISVNEMRVVKRGRRCSLRRCPKGQC
jgi:hypothetical protein